MPTVLIFAVYLVFNFQSMAISWNLTMRGTYLSYGAFVIFDILHAYIRYYLLQIFSEAQAAQIIRILPYAVMLLWLTLFFLLGVRAGKGYQTHSERNITAFRMGAAIYIGTFLLGNNWDYRLAFLIFAIPQLSRWMFTLSARQRWLSLGTFIAVLVSVWYTVIGDYFFLTQDGSDYEFRFYILDEIVNWILFGGLTYLLAASAPEWVRTFKWFPFVIQFTKE